MDVRVLGLRGDFTFEDAVAHFADIGADVALVDPEMVCGRGHLVSAAMHAERVFAEGTNRSKSMIVETILYAACERQIGRALAKMKPRTDGEMVAAVLGFDGDLRLDALGAKEDDSLFAPSADKALRVGAVLFDGVSPEDCVLEQVAMVDLMKQRCPDVSSFKPTHPSHRRYHGDLAMSSIDFGKGKLGFGLMRLPRKDGEIDQEQVDSMVDRFMEAGFTYFDTAPIYPGSEEAMRKALVERYPRESYTVATKNSAWISSKTREEAYAQFDRSLELTGAGYFDFYLLHNLGESRTRIYDDFDLWEFVKEKKREGKIRHIGFSFHSTSDDLEEILRARPETEFVQLQVNWADWDSPGVDSRRCCEVAARYGVPVVVMEPVKGGLLADPPEAVKDILDEAGDGESYASWAVRFAAGVPGVAVVLSGMSDMGQMEDNISYMADFEPLDNGEKEAIRKAQEVLASVPLVPCTGCGYCVTDCPKNVEIPGSLNALNLLRVYGDSEAAASNEDYARKWRGTVPATECMECGRCEDACPQHIPIRTHLAEAAALFHPKD